MSFIIKWIGIFVFSLYLSYLFYGHVSQRIVALGSFSVSLAALVFVALVVYLGYSIKLKS